MRTLDNWRGIRKEHLSKHHNMLVFDEPLPFYMNIPTPFSLLSNVLPEEQEEIVFNELQIFLMGSQTENIRIREFDSNKLPQSIEVNISFDPYIRSELERFHEALIATAIIRIGSFIISHDNVTYSPISATVARAIHEKVSKKMQEICLQLDSLIDSTKQLTELFKAVHSILESLLFFSEVVKTICVEQLIGGQVLSFLDSKRSRVFSASARQDLEDIFQAGWKIFANYIGNLVCRFEADQLALEFVIWSTKGLEHFKAKTKISATAKNAKSGKFWIFEQLCPTFFLKYLDILVRCAEFGEASNVHEIKGKKKRSKKEETERESVENVMEDVRKVDWSNLDVATTVRMLVQFSRKESACLLKEITSATNVDQAIRDIHDLLLKGSCAHDVMLHCIKTDILHKPIDEIGNLRMKKLTNDILSGEADKHHPFWKHFHFTIEKENVFDYLSRRARPGSVSMNQQRQIIIPTFFESLSVSLECPVEIEPIISNSSVFTLIPIFRIWLQLHVASWRIANTRDSLRGMMPSRSGSELTMKKHLINALDWEVANFKQKWSGYVDVMIHLYYERVSKAVSVDEYTECQTIMAREMTKMMGITELSHLENLRDILSIIWNYDNEEYNLAELIADFEEVQSRIQIGAATVA